MLTTIPLPAFNDNYIWMIIQDQTGRAVIVDPGESTPVLQAISEYRITLDAILITHHHADHTGGIADILQHHPAPVYAWEYASIDHSTHKACEGTKISLLDGELTLEVLTIPGHTLDHIAYYDPHHHQLFCGDTLFAGGCGRIFEGTPEQMFASLNKLLALPDDTRLYCAHEYTLSNLAFAKAVEPNNPQIIHRIQQAEQLRKNNQPTLPAHLQLERETNPFCRSHIPDVIQSASQEAQKTLNTPLAVFTTLREWKDHFSPPK